MNYDEYSADDTHDPDCRPPAAFTNPPRLRIRKSNIEARNAAAVLADKDVDEDGPIFADKDGVYTLEPQDHNPLDRSEQYNPLRYCYKVMISELNMELTVKFLIETLSHDEKHPIEFIRDGVPYEIPFFPRAQEGRDPAKDHDGSIDLDTNYKDGEHPYYIVPTVVRAKVLGDPLGNNGEGTDDVLVTRELVILEITPDRLAAAIEELRDDVRDDPNAPSGLHDLLSEALGYQESWSANSIYGDPDPDETAGESYGWDD